MVIALDALFLLFCIFINTTAYHLGRYKPSPPSTKELHGWRKYQKKEREREREREREKEKEKEKYKE